jgi:hypothetical protein
MDVEIGDVPLCVVAGDFFIPLVDYGELAEGDSEIGVEMTNK